MDDFDEMEVVDFHDHPPVDGKRRVLIEYRDSFGRHFHAMRFLDEAC